MTPETNNSPEKALFTAPPRCPSPELNSAARPHSHQMETTWFAPASYSFGLEWMESHIPRVKNHPHLIVIGGFEFEPVVTLGRKVHPEQFPVPDRLKHFELLATNRGGEATIHQPGQLVIYPIFHMSAWGFDVRSWTCLLLRTGQMTLKELGLETEVHVDNANKKVGLYSKKGKVVFIGLRVSQGVSSHGVAINIHNDLSVYDDFISCGTKNAPVDKPHTSLTLEQVYQIWLRHFCKLLLNQA